jgi:hypothetical protein
MKFGFWYVVLYIFFLAMAFAALIGGVSILYKSYDLKYNGVYTNAIVTGWRTTNSSLHDRSSASAATTDGSNNFPIVSYEADKRNISVATRSSADEDGITTGDNVKIVYRKSEPEYAELQQHLSGSFIAGSVCLFIGLLFVSILWIFGYKALKNRTQAANEDTLTQNT